MPLTADAGEALLHTGTPGVTDMTFRQLRQLAQGVIGKGCMSPADLLVSAPGGMQVQVAAGYAWVPGTVITGPDGQHMYGVPLTAAKTLGNVPAPVGGTRRDSVVLRVYDEGDAPGAGLNVTRVEYRVNPVVSLTAEALPANAILLAYVDVTNGAAAITAGMITDRRWLAGRPLVTTLPLNPYDGQEVTLQTADMATYGAAWRLRYSAASASAYKWEFIGGPPIEAEVDTNESTTSGAYVNLATVGPNVTPPAVGEYLLSFGCQIGNTGVAGGYMSFGVNGNAAVTADAAFCGNGQYTQTADRTRKKTVTNLTAITSVYAASGGTALFAARHMRIIPIRLG